MKTVHVRLMMKGKEMRENGILNVFLWYRQKRRRVIVIW